MNGPPALKSPRDMVAGFDREKREINERHRAGFSFVSLISRSINQRVGWEKQQSFAMRRPKVRPAAISSMHNVVAGFDREKREINERHRAGFSFISLISRSINQCVGWEKQQALAMREPKVRPAANSSRQGVVEGFDRERRAINEKHRAGFSFISFISRSINQRVGWEKQQALALRRVEVRLLLS